MLIQFKHASPNGEPYWVNVHHIVYVHHRGSPATENATLHLVSGTDVSIGESAQGAQLRINAHLQKLA